MISDTNTTVKCLARFAGKSKPIVQPTDVLSTTRRTKCKLLQNIKDALDQPYVASEMIVRMKEI